MTKNKLFDLVPINMNEEHKLYGRTIHTNEKIKKIVKKWVEKSSISNPIYSKVNEGIDKNKIIIGYLNKSKINFIKKMYRDKKESAFILGLYDPYTNKIGIVLDDNVNLLGKSIAEIPPIIIHELIHMVSMQKPRLFLSKNMKYLIPFYKYFFTQINKQVASSPDIFLKQAIEEIFYTSEIRTDDFYDEAKLPKIHNIWSLYLRSVLEKDKYEISEIVSKAFLPYELYIAERLRSKYINEANKIAKYILNSYKKIGLKESGIYLVPGQELVYPSEVICCLNEFNINNANISLINRLKF